MLAPPLLICLASLANLYIAWRQNLLFCVLHSATAPRDCGSAPRVRAKGRGVREDKIFFPLLSFVPIMAIGICEHFLGIRRERDLEKGAFLLIYLGPILSLLSFYSIKYNTRHDILHLFYYHPLKCSLYMSVTISERLNKGAAPHLPSMAFHHAQLSQ